MRPSLNSENDILCSSEFRMLLGRVSGLIAFRTSSKISFCFFLVVSKVFANARKFPGVEGFVLAGGSAPLEVGSDASGVADLVSVGVEDTCRSSARGGKVFGRIFGAGPRDSICSSLDLNASRGLSDSSSSSGLLLSTAGGVDCGLSFRRVTSL